MSYEPPFVGYPGQVWATCYQSAAWLASLLSGGAAPAATAANAALAVFGTFMNGADAIAAWQTAAALSQENQNMTAIEALPLSLDPTTTAYFTARTAAIATAASGLSVLPPAVSPFAATGLLAMGQPAVPDTGYLEWCMGLSAETPPSGATSATLVAYASGEATAWSTVTNAIRVLQGQNLTSAYDTAARQYRVASTVSGVVAAVSASTGDFSESNVTTLWNSAVTTPSLLLDASTLFSSPAYLVNQQGATLRFVLRSLAVQIAYFLLSLRAPFGATATTASLRRNETLMDLAARAAGGYESWAAVAAMNGVEPPWPGPTNQLLAQSGTSLLLPGSTLPSSGAALPTYETNTLGVDYDFGPINGTQPAWVGDIPLIVGYANLRRALGRRLQTTLGTLIYHPDFGSRIPPEVGAVQGADEAPRLAAFGAGALSADPRVASVSSAAASVQPGFLATFSGVVIPIGPGASPVGIDATISPLP